MGGLSGTPGRATITPVYWAPLSSFSTSYKTIVNGYLANVAQASGSPGNVFSVSTQYYQYSSNATPQLHIQYQVIAGQEIDDTGAYPPQGGSGCTAPTGYTACVTDLELATELYNKLTGGGMPIDDSHLYLVLLPQGVVSCDRSNSPPNNPQAACSAQPPSTPALPGFCAYHNNTIQPPYLIYASQPFPDLTQCADPHNSGPQSPNGDAYADAQVSLISHEANESITDWAGAWMDTNFYENGDECNYVYGAPLGGTPGTYYNQTINGAHYYTQDEFSNEDYALNIGDAPIAGGSPVPGCVQREEVPVAAFTSPTSVTTGQNFVFDARASSDPDVSNRSLDYQWNWGDGTLGGSNSAILQYRYCSAGTYTVTLTVVDVDGWQSASTSRSLVVVQAAPIVYRLSPAFGPTFGGTSVTIEGCGFSGTSAVKFGSSDATSFSPVSDRQITATAPARTSGIVEVTVTASGGTSATPGPDLFTYSGLTTLDGWGGLHAADSPAVSGTAYWPGWGIARSMRSWPGGLQSGFVLDGWGGLHPFGSQAPAETSSPSNHYWPGWDIARDFAFLHDGSGGVVLDGWGGLHGFSTGSAAPPTATPSDYRPGWDHARKVVILEDGSGGYVLDIWGGLHAFQLNNSPSPTDPSLSAYWQGWDIARDVVLLPGASSRSGYVLDGWGGLHPFGGAPALTNSGFAYWPGWDIARAVVLLPGSPPASYDQGGYTLDGWGGLHRFGWAPTISNFSYWPGWDIAIGICMA
jgi:hypothetical protein